MKIIEGELYNQIMPTEKANITDGSTYASVFYVPKTVTLERFAENHYETDDTGGTVGMTDGN